MKAVFIGSVIFSAKMLKVLIKSDLELIGVITKKKSNYNSDHFNLAKIARYKKIPILYTKDINVKKNIKWLQNKKPDIIFCIGWSQILSKEILKIPKNGVIGFHPTDLPKNKGRHPLIWTIALGLKKSYSTFFLMNSKVDDGPIISKRSFLIKKNDFAQNLYKKTIKIAEIQMRNICKLLFYNKKLFTTKQLGKSNYWRKRSFKDGIIDWRMPALLINNLVRALSTPYPNATFFYKKKKYNLIRSVVIKNKNLNIEPGKVISQSSSDFTIKCGIDSIKIIKSNPKLKLKKKDIYLD